MGDTFDTLVEAGQRADVSGWDFSWLAGRATEERPEWRYAVQLAARLSQASASLDVQTGGGEVLAEATIFPPTAVATESWPPNIDRAARLLHPRGVVVVADADEPPLPFADEAFDLVTSRHPGDRVVGRDRSGPPTRRNILRSARGAGKRVRAHRVLPRPAT